MRRIERPLDGRLAVTLFAAGDITFGEIEVIENPFRIGPKLEEIVVLEEMIVAESRVRGDERLHRRRILLHQIGDAGRAVDDDLIGEVAHAPVIFTLRNCFSL